MAVVNGYCTVAEVRSQLTDSSSKLDAALLEKAVNGTSRAIDEYCGRRFWQDAAPAARLYVAGCRDRLEVADISTQVGLLVEVDPGRSGTWTTLDAADYHLEPLNADMDGSAYAWWTLVIDSGAGLPVSKRPLVRITARWGWSAVPDQVSSAAVLKAVSLFKRKDAPFGIAGFADFGGVRISREDPGVVGLIYPFQKPLVA